MLSPQNRSLSSKFSFICALNPSGPRILQDFDLRLGYIRHLYLSLFTVFLKDPRLCEQMIFTMTGQHRQGERNAFTDLHTAPWKSKYTLTAYIEIKRVSSSAANQIQLIKWSLASMDTFVKAEVLLWSELVQTLKCSKKLQK